MMSDQQRTAEHWAKPWELDSGLYWTDLAAVRQRLNCKVSDNEAEDWLSYTLRRHFINKLPLARCYSLGCGHGEIERQLAGLGAFDQCEASDLSEGAVAEARRAATAAGLTNITYEARDANVLILPVQTYDAIWAHASIHHFDQLEHVFATVAEALKPEGLFIMHEYVGANRFQFSARQCQVIEACLNLLPVQYRQLPIPATSTVETTSMVLNTHREMTWYAQRTWDKLREGAFWSTIGRYWRRRKAIGSGQRPIKETALPTLRSVIAIDPSEAVRSAEIMPVLETMFDVIEYRPLGGTILQFLLANIAGNFQDDMGKQLLEVLLHLEDTLMACGDIPSDFAYIVARPRARDIAG